MSRSGRPRSAWPSPKSDRAWRFIATMMPVAPTTTCAAGAESKARSRTTALTGGSGVVAAGGDDRSGVFVRGTRTNRRRLTSLTANSSECVISISDLPSSRVPHSFRAKLRRLRIRACVSALKYMSVLRHVSRSMREIGASCTRSLRPKITARRRSLRNAWLRSLRSKYFSSRAGGIVSTALSEYTAARASLSASSSMSVAKIFTRSRYSRSPSVSASSTATVYASSPDEQPAHQTRIGPSPPTAVSSFGTVCSATCSQTGASRKKLVTLMRIVLKR